MTAASARDAKDLPDLTGRMCLKCELQKFELARSLAVSAYALGEEVIVARAAGVVGSRPVENFFSPRPRETGEGSWRLYERETEKQRKVAYCPATTT